MSGTGDQGCVELVSLGNQAMIWRATGNLERALDLHREKERISRELGNQKALAISLGNIGNIYADQGEWEAAMDHYKEKEKIDRELGNKSGLEVCLGNQARLLLAQQKPIETFATYSGTATDLQSFEPSGKISTLSNYTS